MDSLAPRCPTALNHILVCGLGSLGQHCVELLKEFGVQIWAIDRRAIEEWEILDLGSLLADVVVGDCRQEEILKQAQIQDCRSVSIVTGDERVNLETAFAVRLLNPMIRIIIRSAKQNLNALLEQQLGNFIAFEPTQLSAPAFALAALGQESRFHAHDASTLKPELLGFLKLDRSFDRVIKRHIQPHDRGCNLLQLRELNLFRIDRQTILTTEYQIEAGDTLNGFLLAEIAYGYGIMPVLHQRSLQESPTLMPSDDIRLHDGDRLVVLATTNGLRRVELGNMLPRLWQVYVEKAMTSEAVFVGANEISRISGCDLSTARSLMNHLPGMLPLQLYDHQAKRLVRCLSRVQVIARAIAPELDFRLKKQSGIDLNCFGEKMINQTKLLNLPDNEL